MVMFYTFNNVHLQLLLCFGSAEQWWFVLKIPFSEHVATALPTTATAKASQLLGTYRPRTVKHGPRCVRCSFQHNMLSAVRLVPGLMQVNLYFDAD